jgi:hypothetical protein
MCGADVGSQSADTIKLGFSSCSGRKQKTRQREPAGARRALSAASAGGGVIQPIPGLFVGPTRDGEARGGRHTLAGTHDDMLARA